MENFFAFLETYRVGILVCFLALGGLVLLLQWLA